MHLTSEIGWARSRTTSVSCLVEALRALQNTKVRTNAPHLVRVRVAGDINLQQKHEMTAVLAEVNKQLGAEFELPQEVTLTASKSGSTALTVVKPNQQYEVQSPYQFSLDGKSKHPIHSRPILAHEYGHVIFDLNFGKMAQEASIDLAYYYETAKEAVPIWERLRPLLQRQAEIDKELGKAHRVEYFQLAHRLESEREAVGRSIDQVGAEWSKLEPILDSMPIRDLYGPYSELFADMVEVIHADNPKAVAHATHLVGRKIAKRSPEIPFSDPPQFRDFAQRYKIKGWSEQEEHVLLTPTRNYVWKYYLSNPLYSKRRPWVLKRVLEAITLELKDRVERPDLRFVSPELANRRLVERINEVIARP